MKRVYFIFGLLLAFCLPILFILIFVANTPDVMTLKTCMNTKMNDVYLCEKAPSYTQLTEISTEVKNAILLSEDAAFYSHKGFDWHELSESLRLNIKRMKLARGGSTITQQLAKNVFLTGRKNLGRKIKEAYIAHKTEQLFTKDEIFEKYLNVIEFGKDLYGIKAASQFYFSKEPDKIHLLEAAFLAFLLPNPKIYSESFENGQLTEYARHRILNICKRLYRFERIKEGQYLAAEKLLDRFPWNDLNTLELSELTDGTSLYTDPFPTDAEFSDWFEPLEEILEN